MPTLSTIPSTEELMEPANLSLNTAFTVLNSSENLKTYTKPNAIVRPSIRHNPPNGEDFMLKNVESQIILDDDDGKSHYDLGSFTKELDIKLRRLQRDKKGSSKNSSNGDTIQKRPLFITTVPTGIFLQPTRELPPVPPPRRTYAYFSIPKILANSNDNASGIQTTPPKMPFKKSRQREMPPQNIMHDKRIFRGSNFGHSHNTWNPYFAYAGLLSGKTETDAINKEQEARRRQLLRKRNIEHQRTQRGIIGTPPPVKGRRHENVQTDKYLEELLCRPSESDAQCQTDLFLHRPPTPPSFTPAKGVDAHTSIPEGELFNFEKEVTPILEMLVGRTVEQSLLEVLNEEEFAEIHKQQQEIKANREFELASLKRLENQEIRLQEEKKRRLHQENISRELDREMQEKVTAAKLLQGYVADLLPGVLHSIEPFLETENKEELESTLGPWLSQQVAEEVGRMVDSQDLLEELVREIIEDRAGKYSKLSESKETPNEQTD